MTIHGNPSKPAHHASLVFGAVLVVLFAFSMSKDTFAQSGGGLESEARSFASKYKRPDQIPYPESNPYSAYRYLLGKQLFFEPRLSASGIMSCATCHNPSFVWQDSLSVGVGHGMKKLGRRTPTLLNLAWGGPFFWDGRAESLEEQALGPIASSAEMNLPLDEMVRRLRSIKGYAPTFDAAYPGEGITPQTVAKAIATFERSLVSGQAAFDRWLDGDTSALSDSAKRGFVLFNTKARCAVCHSDWRFTDDSFHDVGLSDADKGRGAVVKIVKAMQFAFKTPTLRNVEKRAPYMHNGKLPTLAAVMDHYDRGGEIARPSLSKEMRKLGLSVQDKTDLIELMRALSSTDRWITMPLLPQ